MKTLKLSIFLLFSSFLVKAQSLSLSERKSTLEKLIAKIENGYVVPASGLIAIDKLRTMDQSGAYDSLSDPKYFAARVTTDLREVTHDKHIALFFDPEKKTPVPTAPAAQAITAQPPHERYNYGFYKLERLRGNVGYLDLRSFENATSAKATATAYMEGLSNFDAVILDLRNNGGGYTPMAVWIASYFFGKNKIHFTDMQWTDEKRTIELWTNDSLPGKGLQNQDLYILVSRKTFSAAEDFTYSMQQLKRATIIGDTTGGGAHMGRGVERLSAWFTAFIPTGQSINPITKTNWENIGVIPDIFLTSDDMITQVQILALTKILERETDSNWQNNLRQSIAELSAKK